MTYLAQNQYAKLESYEDAIRKVKEYGAEPIMQVNLMGLRPVSTGRRYMMSNTADAALAARFVAHVNGELKLDLKHICIGNEFAQWADTHADIWPFDQPLSADDYIDRYIRFAIAIRQAQENVSGNGDDIKLWGPEISISYADWQTANMTKDCEWTSVHGVIKCSYGNGEFDHFLPYFFNRLKLAESDTKINPKGYKLLDYASFHYYPTFRTDINDVGTILTDSSGHQLVNEMLESTQIFHNKDYTNKYDRSSYMNFNPNIMGRMQEWKNQYYPEAKLALSEFAVDSFDTSSNYHPIIRPLYMADLIGIAAYNGVRNFNRSFLNTKSPEPIPWSLFLDDKPTNLYNIYQLYTKYFIGRLLNVSDDFEDKVNSYATINKNESGKEISLFVVNKSAKQYETQVNLIQNNKLLGSLPYTLTPWSVTLFRIPQKGLTNSNVEVLEYGAKEMGIAVDTHYQ